MKIVVRRTKFVGGYNTLELVGGWLEGYVHTTRGAVSVYGQTDWACFRLTIDGREYIATVDAPGPPSAAPLRRLARRFARTVAKLAADSPGDNGPFTVTLAR